MAKAHLRLFVDRGVRSSVARQQLKNLNITFEEVNVDANEEARSFINQIGRPVSKYPLPQYYVADVPAWDKGYEEVGKLTAEEINQKIEEINASI